MQERERDAILARVRERLAAGDKLGAIKLHREATGLSLAESKDFVEQVMTRGEQAPTTARGPMDAATMGQIHALVAANRLIEAIKLYRERTGVGLKEAKDAVESIALGKPPADPDYAVGDAASRVVSRPGAASRAPLVLFIVAAAVVVALLFPSVRRALFG